MSWQDLGLIFPVKNLEPWAISHVYVPTAIHINNVIRVYAAFLDNDKHGRLGFIDVDINDPSVVVNYSKQPLLADSNLNMFDCDGVTPLTIVENENNIFLYYAGWQKFNCSKKRYTLYTGLAISDKDGYEFKRYSHESIIGPRFADDLVRTSGVVLKENNLWRTWLASFSKNILIGDKFTPTYNLTTMTSNDGITWNNDEKVLFEPDPNTFMGYGRSAIWKEDNIYNGLFSARSWDGRYHNIWHSTSEDSITWAPLSLDSMAFKASNTCDGQNEVCFPSIIKQQNRTLMFYSGNDFGKEGLRLAIWTP